jgi:hypothetical protein
MAGCIVGWAQSKFGRHDDRDVESLIVEVAQRALANWCFAAPIQLAFRRATHRNDALGERIAYPSLDKRPCHVAGVCSIGARISQILKIG